MKTMLHLLYGQTDGFTLADTDGDLPSGYECLKPSFGLITLADKYDIPDLKAYGESWFHLLLHVFSNSLPELLALVPYVYAEFKDQHRHLHHAMVHELLKYPDKILAEDSRSKMMDLMHSIPEFRQEVFMGFFANAILLTRRPSGRTGL